MQNQLTLATDRESVAAQWQLESHSIGDWLNIQKQTLKFGTRRNKIRSLETQTKTTIPVHGETDGRNRKDTALFTRVI